MLARVRALIRRRELDRQEGQPAVLHVGGVQIDRARCEVVVDDRHVPLTPSELKVLSLLAEHPEQVFSRRQILEHLWDSTFVGDEHACDIHISNLRRKIEPDPRVPRRLVTVRGFGYKLVPA